MAVTARSATRRAGFTLIETAVSVFILSLMMAALTSVVMFVARAAPEPGSPGAVAPELLRTVQTIDADLSLATTFVTAQASEIELSLPDRDGNDVDENIHYRWFGEGTPLRRSYNGGPFEAVSPVLADIVFAFTRVSLREPIGEPREQEAELSQTGDNGSSNSASTASGTRYAQPITPDLEDDDIAWSIGEVELYITTAGAGGGGEPAPTGPALNLGIVSIGVDLDSGLSVNIAGESEPGEVTVSVYLADVNGRPVGSALASDGVPVSDLAQHGKHSLGSPETLVTFAFSPAPVIGRDDDVVFVLAADEDIVFFQTDGTPSGDSPMLSSTAGGAWTSHAGSSVNAVRGSTYEEPPVSMGVSLVDIELITEGGPRVRFASAPPAPTPVLD
jgi:hypothetical protein